MNVNVVYNHADNRLLSRRAIEALRGYQETNLLRGLVMHLGFKTAIVTYAARRGSPESANIRSER